MSVEHDLIKDLRFRSTLGLLLLSSFTLSLYTAHYMMRQARTLNRHIAPEYRMSIGYTRAVLVLMYASVLVIIPYFLIEDVEMLDNMNDVLNLITTIAVIGWSLMVRTRMNYLLKAGWKDKKRFDFILSALFPVFYTNFKINRVNRLLSRELSEGG